MQSYALDYRCLTFSFQTRIPTVLNKTIINELCAESRDIQEKNERAKGAGLLPHLFQVATGILDSFGDQNICYFHNETSITYLKGEANAADRETLNRYIDNGNNDVYMDRRERCNRYCNLWARKTILVIVSQMKKHNIHTQTLTRRDRARGEQHTKRTDMFLGEDQELANDMIEALQSIYNQQRKMKTKMKTNQIFPTVLGMNRPTTIVDYYYQLLDPATIEGRYGPMKGFLAVDIDCVQILLWACYKRESLQSLITYLQKPSSSEKIQYEGKHITDLELHTNALASLCAFVSTCVLRYIKNKDDKDEVSKCMHAHLIASSAFRDGLAFISEAGLNPKTHLIDALREKIEILRTDKEICEQFLLKVEGYDIEEAMKSVGDCFCPKNISSLLLMAAFHGFQCLESNDAPEDNTRLINDEFETPSLDSYGVLPCKFFKEEFSNKDIGFTAVNLLKNFMSKKVIRNMKNKKNWRSKKRKQQDTSFENIVQGVNKFMDLTKKIFKDSTISAIASQSSNKVIKPSHRVSIQLAEKILGDIQEEAIQFTRAITKVDEIRLSLSRTATFLITTNSSGLAKKNRRTRTTKKKRRMWKIRKDNHRLLRWRKIWPGKTKRNYISAIWTKH